jgi:hypothetical protein
MFKDSNSNLFRFIALYEFNESSWFVFYKATGFTSSSVYYSKLSVRRKMNVNSTRNNSRLLNSLVAPLNMLNNATGNMMNLNTNSSNSSSGFPIFGIVIFLALVGVVIALLVVYQDELSLAWENLKNTLGYGSTPEPIPETPPPSDVTPPEPSSTPSQSLVEKVLPGGGNEVFNVSSNKYTYYDAEPLCRAFGAELATYEQVKQAWEKGADWCNYGWSKGQLALYPTSEETYAKLQGGPEDQRMACGKPGMNGGYFDNPELRFGVNCYGKKPPQSANDLADLTKGAPLSPDALAFDKKVNEFKTNVGTIGVNPFNPNKWGSA